MAVGVRDTVLKQYGHQQLTNPAVSTALTVPAGARVALLQCTAGTAIRLGSTVTAPTTSLGIRLVGATFDKLWYTGELTKLRVISETTGTLDVEYFG